MTIVQRSVTPAPARQAPRGAIGCRGIGCRGIASVEFALLTPLLAILLAGLVEIGITVIQTLQVQAAAEAGALYAANHGTSSLANINLAVTSATGTTGITAAPTATAYCGCPSTTGIASQGADCSTLCPDGKLPSHYAKVNASITHTPLISLLHLPLPATITRSVVIRVQ